MDQTTFKLGIDVGGTFTDVFLVTSTGAVDSFKVLTTPEDPSIGVLDGLGAAASALRLTLAEFAARVTTIVHGTTVTTNAVLTRNGARTGLLTTDGVRDALEMRRGIREEQYDNRFPNAVPLVPRHLRLPVGGRIDWEGAELAPLDLEGTAGVRAQARRLRAEGCGAVAICFLNAFANPAHEGAAAEVVRQEMPGAFVSVSTEVLPVMRFYNRISTTALNAFVGPVLARYLDALSARIAASGFRGVLLIMQSNGGVALPEATRALPASTLLSGPAGGPTAAVAFTEPHGSRDCILVDMGGTSFDASLVREGAAAMTHQGDIDRLRIALPMLAITTIGAGGGSIGWIDEGGMLRMGPQSAGALPGPACYGRGGERPTCTDSNLLLGYLDPEFFAGGRLRLDVDRARRAVEQAIARPLAMSVEQAAIGMYRVINANMAHGVREVSVKRGLDAREFPLVIAGGAGALHACAIAAELEIPTVLVPRAASVLCAAGMLMTDLKHDRVRSFIHRFRELEVARLASLCAEMRAAGEAELRRESVACDRITHELALDLRYVKQYHEVTLPVQAAQVERGDLDAIARAFHAEHDRLYGYSLADDGTDLELINVRVRSVGRTERVAFPHVAEGGPDAAAARKGQRRAWVPEYDAFTEVPVYDAGRLRGANVLRGPALVERADTTIVLGAGYTLSVDTLGSCLLRPIAAPEVAS